jgi:hypothetical protein
VCERSHGLQEADWVEIAEVNGVPSVYEFIAGGH